MNPFRIVITQEGPSPLKESKTSGLSSCVAASSRWVKDWMGEGMRLARTDTLVEVMFV